MGFLTEKKVGPNSVESLPKVEQVRSEITEIVGGEREVVIREAEIRLWITSRGSLGVVESGGTAAERRFALLFSSIAVALMVSAPHTCEVPRGLKRLRA